MVDNTVLDAGAGGDTIGTDDIGGVKFQRIKLIHGADGTNDGDVATGNPLPVDLRELAGASIPTGGGVESGSLRVTIANDSTGVVSVDDNGGALTVDGTVSVDINAGTNNIGDVDVLSVVPGTGATNLGKAEDAAHTSGDTGILALAVRRAADTPTSGADGDYEPLKTDANGHLKVEIFDGGDSHTVDGTVTVTHPQLGNGTAAGSQRVTIASDTTGVLSVDDNGGSLTVDVGTALPAGTNNIGDVDIASALPAGTNNIGDVDIASVAAGTTIEAVGDVAHDAAAAGNPVLICGIAQDVDDTAPPNRISAENDAARLATDFDGAVFTRPHGPQIWSHHTDSSSAQTDTTVHAAPGAGLSLYVTDIVFSSGAATAINLFFEEGATTVLGPYYLEATAGRGMSIHFQTPKKITANTALTFTTSAAILHTVDVTGYTAQG